jgi:hypothetical protein
MAPQQLRRLCVGDRVRFRLEAHHRLNYDIAPDEVGVVVGVEPHPPATGPTYKVSVKFACAVLPYIFSCRYELVQTATEN